MNFGNIVEIGVHIIFLVICLFRKKILNWLNKRNVLGEGFNNKDLFIESLFTAAVVLLRRDFVEAGKKFLLFNVLSGKISLQQGMQNQGPLET